MSTSVYTDMNSFNFVRKLLAHGSSQKGPLQRPNINLTPLPNIISFKSIFTRWRSGWGTALQTGRSRVRFPMVSLEFFIDILPAELWPWGRLSL
jgi:hypothetical protein